jgi:hypothetical protein
MSIAQKDFMKKLFLLSLAFCLNTWADSSTVIQVSNEDLNTRNQIIVNFPQFVGGSYLVMSFADVQNRTDGYRGIPKFVNVDIPVNVYTHDTTEFYISSGVCADANYYKKLLDNSEDATFKVKIGEKSFPISRFLGRALSNVRAAHEEALQDSRKRACSSLSFTIRLELIN